MAREIIGYGASGPVYASHELTTLRAQVETLTRERDEARDQVANEIDRAPEPLRRLGEYLSNLLDEDRWPQAERMLLGALTTCNASEEKVRRLVECLREISRDRFRSDIPGHERLTNRLATVSDITAPTDEVQS
jgi:hypothetical protein